MAGRWLTAWWADLTGGWRLRAPPEKPGARPPSSGGSAGSPPSDRSSCVAGAVSGASQLSTDDTGGVPRCPMAVSVGVPRTYALKRKPKSRSTATTASTRAPSLDPSVTYDDKVGRIGRYTLQGRLGAGASGKVYLGTHGSCTARVAISVLHRGWTEALQEEFARLRTLHHPNLVRVLELRRTHGGCPCIVTDHVAGETLQTAFVDKRGGPPCSDRQLSSMATQLASMVAYLSRHGAVHRDVKPSNVVVKDVEVLPHLVLVDFGFPPLCTGTVGYHAPEVLLGWKCDGAVDVWGLGVTVAAVLLRQPFPSFFDHERLWEYEGASDAQVREWESAAPLQPSVPERTRAESPGCVDFVLRCTTVLPSERSEARELLAHPWVCAAQRAQVG